MRAQLIEREREDASHWPRVVRELGDAVGAAQRAVAAALHVAAMQLRREDARRVTVWLTALEASHESSLGALLRKTSGGFVGIDAAVVRDSLRRFLHRHASQRAEDEAKRAADKWGRRLGSRSERSAAAKVEDGEEDEEERVLTMEEEAEAVLERVAVSAAMAQDDLWALTELYDEVPPLLLVRETRAAVSCIQPLTQSIAAMDAAYKLIRVTLPARIRAAHAEATAVALAAATSTRLLTELFNRMLRFLKASTEECAAARSKLRRALGFTIDGARSAVAWSEAKRGAGTARAAGGEDTLTVMGIG